MVLQELRKRQRSGDEAQQLQRIDSVRSQEEELSREEIIRRLRLLGQPITLFGEVSATVGLSRSPHGTNWPACLQRWCFHVFPQSHGVSVHHHVDLSIVACTPTMCQPSQCFIICLL